MLKTARCSGLLCLIVLVAGCSSELPPAELAEDYPKRLMDGDLVFLNQVHTPEMISAFDEKKVTRLIQGLQDQHGTLLRFEPAVFSGTVDGFSQYRIPAVFANRTMDFRVVLTKENKVAGVFIEPHQDRGEVPSGDLELLVLGIAQDGGVPHVGCYDPCCAEARSSGETLFPVCLGIFNRNTKEMLLVEATPQIEAQLDLFSKLTGQMRSKDYPVDGLLLTHAHMGHYLGLAHFGREVADAESLKTWVTPAMGKFLEHNAPWSQLVELDQIRLHQVSYGRSFSPITGLMVTAVKVPHRDELSDTVAFRLATPASTVLFVPDVDSWDKHPGLLDELLTNVDLAFIDATFWDGSEVPGRSLAEIPHPPMTRSMELLRERVQSGGPQIYFIHLNHSNRALHEPGIRHKLEQDGFQIAEQGSRFSL